MQLLQETKKGITFTKALITKYKTVKKKVKDLFFMEKVTTKIDISKILLQGLQVYQICQKQNARI